MASEHGIFDGRRGSKRMKTVEKSKEEVLAEFVTGYRYTAEMNDVLGSVKWESTAELIFVMAVRNVHFAWSGLRDFGFLRICRTWIRQKEEAAMTPKTAVEMLKAVLPEGMCRELGEELAALEIA